MNLTGICKATGLPDEDKLVLAELIEVHDDVAPRNRRLGDYYAAEQSTPTIGIDNIPETVNPGARCDWASKAVTSVSERVRLDGFVFDGEYEDEVLRRVTVGNDLVGEYNRCVANELVHGCMFATVQRNGSGVSVRMHSAETSSAIWDTAASRIGAGFVVADAKRTPWHGKSVVPVQINLHLPGRVDVIRRTGATNWVAEAMATPLDRPMMEAFCFRPTGTKPFGQTRITRTVRYLVDEVERTLRYMAVSNAIYATPMMAALGLTDAQFDALDANKSKWLMSAGSWFLSTRDEEGKTPELEIFSGQNPTPYITAIETYAKLFSGATGVPLNSLGIVQDNPSSAEAIDSAREDICTAAEDLIESNRVSMRNVALMAMAVEANTTVDGLSDEQLSVMPRFKNPSRPSLAATADAMVKIAGVMDGFSATREFLSGMGFDAAEVESIRSQLKRIQASNAAMATAQAALIQSQAQNGSQSSEA